MADETYEAAVAACPTPAYHQTHRYCPSCPWIEQGPLKPRLKVTFQGASDDLIEVAGCPGADEISAIQGHALLALESPSEGILGVLVRYEVHGCWSVGFVPSDEGMPIPSWPIRFAEPINDYTVCVEVDCPHDVTLTVVQA